MSQTGNTIVFDKESGHKTIMKNNPYLSSYTDVCIKVRTETENTRIGGGLEHDRISLPKKTYPRRLALTVSITR